MAKAFLCLGAIFLLPALAAFLLRARPARPLAHEPLAAAEPKR